MIFEVIIIVDLQGIIWFDCSVVWFVFGCGNYFFVVIVLDVGDVVFCNFDQDD